jgi:hypothetical protein
MYWRLADCLPGRSTRRFGGARAGDGVRPERGQQPLTRPTPSSTSIHPDESSALDPELG